MPVLFFILTGASEFLSCCQRQKHLHLKAHIPALYLKIIISCLVDHLCMIDMLNKSSAMNPLAETRYSDCLILAN